MCQGNFRLDIRKKVFHTEGVWSLQWAPQGTGHSAKPGRVQKALGQYSQTHGVTFGEYCTGPGGGLNYPDGSPSTQHII